MSTQSKSGGYEQQSFNDISLAPDCSQHLKMSDPAPSRYKDALVEAALRGSAASIHSLSEYIDSAEDYDVDLCVRLSPLIDARRIPSDSLYNSTTFASDPNNTLLCATATFTVITRVHRGLCAGHPSKPRIAQYFRENLASFYQWIEFLVSKRILLGTSASLIGMIASTDSQLLLNIMASPRALELAVSVWSSEDNSGRHPVLSKYRHCPILDVVMGFRRHEVGKTMFKAYLDEEPGRVGNMAKIVRVRTQQLVQRFNEKELQWDFALEHLLQLLNLSWGLLGGHKGWVAVCGTEDLLKLFTASLGVFSAGEESLDCWRLVLKALFRIHELTFEPSLGTYPALLKVAAITKGGVLRLLIECALRFVSNTEKFDTTSLIIRRLTAYAFYHEVSQALTPATLDLADRMENLGRTDEGEKLRLIITTGVKHAASIHDDLRDAPRRFCDGLSHAPCASAKGAIGKNFTGMNAIAKLLPGVSAISRDGSNIATVERIRRLRRFTPPLNALIHFVDCVSVPAALDLMLVAKYKQREHGEPAHLKNRINAYLLHALQSPDVYLVEALFPYGGATVHFLIKMTKANGRYYAIGSISWVNTSTYAKIRLPLVHWLWLATLDAARFKAAIERFPFPLLPLAGLSLNQGPKKGGGLKKQLEQIPPSQCLPSLRTFSD
ncbi:hypothetical protein EST38_g13459 [Candolleomyces aberdarensis]|uniref:Uncharacterized protein n=1 Tax=Candolleomyces aberdarensis TaxID=2316362 RepID=A0A4Q2D1R6_9AGAR|nr:hypothetical protein EST38_g13459 [Candolleomyces aberdarensis]